MYPQGKPNDASVFGRSDVPSETPVEAALRFARDFATRAKRKRPPLGMRRSARAAESEGYHKAVNQ